MRVPLISGILPSLALILTLTPVLALALLPRAASAACDCLCVDGSRKTLCHTLEEARLEVNACAGYSAEGCPVNLARPQPRGYAAPEAGAVNCRDAEVFNAASGEQAAVRICDVEPAP